MSTYRKVKLHASTGAQQSSRPPAPQQPPPPCDSTKLGELLDHCGRNTNYLDICNDRLESFLERLEGMAGAELKGAAAIPSSGMLGALAEQSVLTTQRLDRLCGLIDRLVEYA
jgi:hypothetical protein